MTLCRHCLHSLYILPPLSSHHRDLHSFPTRRSSDLASPRNAAPPTVSLSALPPSDRASTRPPHPAGPDARASRRGRSEEHTSELQSHSDLVCRLLLEKQKTYVR